MVRILIWWSAVTHTNFWEVRIFCNKFGYQDCNAQTPWESQLNRTLKIFAPVLCISSSDNYIYHETPTNIDNMGIHKTRIFDELNLSSGSNNDVEQTWYAVHRNYTWQVTDNTCIFDNWLGIHNEHHYFGHNQTCNNLNMYMVKSFPLKTSFDFWIKIFSIQQWYKRTCTLYWYYKPWYFE